MAKKLAMEGCTLPSHFDNVMCGSLFRCKDNGMLTFLQRRLRKKETMPGVGIAIDRERTMCLAVMQACWSFWWDYRCCFLNPRVSVKQLFGALTLFSLTFFSSFSTMSNMNSIDDPFSRETAKKYQLAKRHSPYWQGC